MRIAQWDLHILLRHRAEKPIDLVVVGSSLPQTAPQVDLESLKFEVELCAQTLKEGLHTFQRTSSSSRPLFIAYSDAQNSSFRVDEIAMDKIHPHLRSRNDDKKCSTTQRRMCSDT